MFSQKQFGDVCLIYIVLFASLFVVDGRIVDESCCKIVATNNGLVRGQIKKTFLNEKLYYAYQGIPFGRAPVGELRFKVKKRTKQIAYTQFMHENVENFRKIFIPYLFCFVCVFVIVIYFVGKKKKNKIK